MTKAKSKETTQEPMILPFNLQPTYDEWSKNKKGDETFNEYLQKHLEKQLEEMKEKKEKFKKIKEELEAKNKDTK